MTSSKPHLLLMGQTPPPWHGQAVATQILFDHDWPDFEVDRLRMEFSGEMQDVGRFQLRKIGRLFSLIRKARAILKQHPGSVLFYPPASANWIPFLRDLLFLTLVRPLAGSTVFIYHASGLPVFVKSGLLRRWLGYAIYRNCDVSLEVARELVPPHQVFSAKSSQWCPCAIEVPNIERGQRPAGQPFTVLFVGSLQEGKGVLEILKTAALLKSQGRANEFLFRIVGKWFSADFEAAARHLHAEMQLGPLVDFVGQLTGDEKWQAYAEADLFFFPTHYASEATPLVIMEALGMGLPVVSTLWAGIPAMVDGCATAHLLPVKSPARFAACLVEQAAQLDQRHQIDSTSRAYYRANFLPARFVERVERACLQAANQPPAPLRVIAYLADQNPGFDRSYGISRMSQLVLEAVRAKGRIWMEVITSRTSQQAPEGVDSVRQLPWGTRRKWVRFLTDHFHPLIERRKSRADVHYFPKGYLPLLSSYCRPSVVTIHDTIIQYDQDQYPRWRKPAEYAYWDLVLKHTLRRADRILTVSEFSKQQIDAFMARHGIPTKPITITYEPCWYEKMPQPHEPVKDNYVVHLASCEPHKRTAHLVRWWLEAEAVGRDLPTLHLIGAVPPEILPSLQRSTTIVKRPFLEESALQAAYTKAKALILPSEIEGFGLPALEAYYLGTPVCFVKATSVEEILHVATQRGGFTLDHPESLFAALDEVMAMTPDEVHHCGLKLRAAYAADMVAQRMIEVFDEVKGMKA